MPARTPREAKQEFLTDLVTILRTVTVKYESDESTATVVQRLRDENIKTIKEVASRHGLYIPPKE